MKYDWDWAAHWFVVFILIQMKTWKLSWSKRNRHSWGDTLNKAWTWALSRLLRYIITLFIYLSVYWSIYSFIYWAIQCFTFCLICQHLVIASKINIEKRADYFCPAEFGSAPTDHDIKSIYGPLKYTLKVTPVSFLHFSAESRWLSIPGGHDAERPGQGETRAEAGCTRGRDGLHPHGAE